MLRETKKEKKRDKKKGTSERVGNAKGGKRGMGKETKKRREVNQISTKKRGGAGSKKKKIKTEIKKSGDMRRADLERGEEAWLRRENRRLLEVGRRSCHQSFVAFEVFRHLKKKTV